MARRKDGTVRGRPTRPGRYHPKGVVPPQLAPQAAKWVKGMPSPNPGGRPRGIKLVTYLARKLEQPVGVDADGKPVLRGDRLIEVLIQMAEAGTSFPALKEILERHDGKVPDRMEGGDGSAVRILVEHVKVNRERDSDSDT